VIRLQGVPHAEERPEAGAREEFEYWHNVAVAAYST
jgi:hypothetical protein